MVDHANLQNYAVFNEMSTQNDLRKRVTQKNTSENNSILLQKTTRKVDHHTLRKTEAIESSIAKVMKMGLNR